MNRGHRLQYCKICNNQKMDFKKGLVCRFTNEQATFKTTCPDFSEDYTKTIKVEQEAIYRAKIDYVGSESPATWKTVLALILLILKILYYVYINPKH